MSKSVFLTQGVILLKKMRKPSNRPLIRSDKHDCAHQIATKIHTHQTNRLTIPMKNATKRTLCVLTLASLALFAFACSSDSKSTTSTDDIVEPTSETAFIETVEATTNESVGMTDETREIPTDDEGETVEIIVTEPDKPETMPKSFTATMKNVDSETVEFVIDSELPDALPSSFIATVKQADGQTSQLIFGDAAPLGENFLVPLVPIVDDLALTVEQQASVEREAWENRLSGIWEDNIDGVVLINLESDSFFGSGTGAGWVWDNQGHIVTNYHVVRPTTNFVSNLPISVETFDGETYEAEFIGGDHVSDIAVIKIDVGESLLNPLTVGDSAHLRPGMTAIALGHPFGAEQAFSMTHGIISGLSRSIQSEASTIPIPAVIQTDADMNPGNSGGPLLNSAGEVIGVNTQIRSISNTNSGVGFATPINLVRRVVNNLIENGVHEYPLIGISSWVITQTWAERLDLDEGQRGLLVTAVSPDGPADQAGIIADSGVVSTSGTRGPKGDGDIIVRIDNVTIDNIYDLRSYIMLNTSPGDQIVIEVLRDNQIIPISVTLGSWGDRFN